MLSLFALALAVATTDHAHARPLGRYIRVSEQTLTLYKRSARRQGEIGKRPLCWR